MKTLKLAVLLMITLTGCLHALAGGGHMHRHGSMDASSHRKYVVNGIAVHDTVEVTQSASKKHSHHYYLASLASPGRGMRELPSLIVSANTRLSHQYCAFSDEMLLEFIGAVKVSNLSVQDRVFIATHRGPEVAKEIVRSFHGNPDGEALVAIARVHPGIIPAPIWGTLPQTIQMQLAECDPAVSRALLSRSPPLPQRAWLHAHCTPPTLELLDEWKTLCSDSDLDQDMKQQWLPALEQLAATDEGARTMADPDFPWPEGDKSFKGQVMMKVIEQNPLLFRADMITDLKAIRTKKLVAYKELGSILARHYSELRSEELTPEVFQKLPMITRKSFSTCFCTALTRKSVLQHLPADIAKEVQKELTPGKRVTVELPAPMVEKHYMDNRPGIQRPV